MDRSILERAQQFGNAVHKIVELHEKGTLDEASLRPQEQYLADMTPILEAWKAFKRDKAVKVLYVERPVASVRYCYAGRLDAIVEMEVVGKIRRRVLVEVKSRPYNPVLEPLQTSAYMEAWNESADAKERVDARCFVELRLDGTYDARFVKGREDFHYFRCVLAAWNWRRGNGGQ